jgi:hypothetical protein
MLSMKREPLTYVECSLPRTTMTLAEYRRSRIAPERPRGRFNRLVHAVRAPRD